MFVATGIYYAMGLVAAGLLVGYLTRPAVGIPLYLLAAFCLYFFRDPERTVPAGDVAVSPADGKVVAIAKEDGGPAGRPQTRISIFLNVFDVHVNRSPIAGKVVDIEYKKGKYLVASRPEASLENEMNTLTVEDGQGSRVVFKQIAGLIARRIVCWKKEGDMVKAGERIGLIKFGSRVDVFLGPEWELAVQEGQRVSAAVTILARRKGA